MDKLNEQHFRCTCFSHSVSVSRFEDFPEIAVEVWYIGGVTGKSLWRRIRDAWTVLVTGDLILHEVILTPEQAERMGNKLIKLVEKDV